MTKAVKRLAPEGKVHFVVGPFGWAKDEDLEVATKNAAKYCSFPSGKRTAKGYVYLTGKDAVLTDYGSWYYDPKQGKPEDTGETVTIKKTRRY